MTLSLNCQTILWPILLYSFSTPDIVILLLATGESNASFTHSANRPAGKNNHDNALVVVETNGRNVCGSIAIFDFDTDSGVFACGFGANFGLWSVF